MPPRKTMMKRLRHPPSRELWNFCLVRLRELRGPETRDRDLSVLLGFEHSRAVRWKEGQMYVDRAEFLLLLADALQVDTMLLVAIAAGTVNAEQAQKELRSARNVDEDERSRKKGNPAEVSADASRFAIDRARFEGATRGIVLLIAGSGGSREALGEALARHADVGGLAATEFSLGVCLAERHRPELVLLDLGLASVQAFDACRAFSQLTSRSRRRCKVVAGAAPVTDAVEQAAHMAGASCLVPFPFVSSFLDDEIDRLEARAGPRRTSSKQK
jgi:hypothetical protein